MEETMNITELMNEKQIILSRLEKLVYGSIEVRENDNKKYIYVHYRENGLSRTKYAGEYSVELYNVILENNRLAKEYKKRLKEIEERLGEIDSMLSNASKGYVNVDDVIYPGCKVTVASVTTYIKAETKHCCLVRDGADIRVTAYR